MRKHTARNAVAAIVAGIILAVTVAPPAMAEDSAAPAAQLSVTLTSNQKTVTAGDKITYTGRLQNLGASDTDVTIDLDAPAYVKLGKSTGAKVDKSDAKWTATLGPGKTKTFVIKANIGKIPSSERRVTTVASVYVGDAKPRSCARPTPVSSRVLTTPLERNRRARQAPHPPARRPRRCPG